MLLVGSMLMLMLVLCEQRSTHKVWSVVCQPQHLFCVF